MLFLFFLKVSSLEMFLFGSYYFLGNIIIN